jgi:gas vesicle protein
MFNDNERGSARPFAAGMLLGALVGAGLALLFAPQSGEETRRLLRRRAKKLADEATDRFDDIKDRIRHVKRRAESALTD